VGHDGFCAKKEFRRFIPHWEENSDSEREIDEEG
jgi:hypothetical protein